VWEDAANVFAGELTEYQAGRAFTGGRLVSPVEGTQIPASPRRGHVNSWHDELGTGAVVALDPHTGMPKWKWKTHDVNTSGILTTASDLLFVGSREGYFQALDAGTGKLLWKVILGWHTTAAPITYELEREQYVAMNAGHCLFVFGLRN
jgi:glucose dehydrogenase